MLDHNYNFLTGSQDIIDEVRTVNSVLIFYPQNRVELTKICNCNIFNHMVEGLLHYNSVFHALADETRRDILLQLQSGEKTITEIAKRYSMSFAAVAKHLNVLEAATL